MDTEPRHQGLHGAGGREPSQCGVCQGEMQGERQSICNRSAEAGVGKRQSWRRICSGEPHPKPPEQRFPLLGAHCVCVGSKNNTH